MKKNTWIACALALALLVSGCAGRTENPEPSESGETSGSTAPAGTQSGGEGSLNPDEIFSDRDFEVGYDENESVHITLGGDSISCSSNSVEISGSTVTILEEGTYILSGKLEDGMVIVSTDKKEKVQLVLNGVSIHSETCAPIYVLQSDKVFITLADGTENTLSNGGSFTAIDDNNIDAVIFSKDDLTLNGSGSLTVTSPAGHGIVSKDSLTITSGTYAVTAASHALAGKDDVSIANAFLTLNAGKDGIHAENSDDETLGYVFIQSGTFQICTEGDGISAAADLRIEGGSFDITTGGGSENGSKQTSDNWGGFPGGPGGSWGGSKPGSSSGSTEDSTSIKGIKAGGNLTVNGGTFLLDTADDSLHCNASLTVNGGNFVIASGDDGFHADDTLTVNDGTILITESYEGLEGLHVNVTGGDITLTASDDGVNAAGGTDSSGTGGRGTDQFGGRGGMGGFGGMTGGSSGGSITISGGTLHVTASGDGLDANGSLTISGGYTVVCGPTQGDTSTLDYDTTAVITGGTFIGTGASGMAQSFSDSGQGVIAVRISGSAGTEITVADADGNIILRHTPELSFAVVILSSPELRKGETYTLTVGTTSGEVEAG